MRKAIVTLVAGLPLLFSLAPITAAGASASSASSACVTSDLHGNCGPYSASNIILSDGYNTYVSNNGWACGTPGSCGRQTLTAHSAGSWSVASQQAAGNTAVLTYPDVMQIFTNAKDVDPQVSHFGHVYSRSAESMPAVRGLDAEAGYDIWLSGTKGPDEIMVWVDEVGRGTGGARQIGKATIFNQLFNVLEYGHGEIIFSLAHNEQAGTVHILLDAALAPRHGYLSAVSRICRLRLRWEIGSTFGYFISFVIPVRYSLRLGWPATRAPGYRHHARDGASHRAGGWEVSIPREAHGGGRHRAAGVRGFARGIAGLAIGTAPARRRRC